MVIREQVARVFAGVVVGLRWLVVPAWIVAALAMTWWMPGLGSGEPFVDADLRLIRIPVGSEGPTVLLETVRRLDDANVPIEDIALHRPTLDDVFLSLTGHAAEMELQEEQASESGPDQGRKRRRRKER